MMIDNDFPKVTGFLQQYLSGMNRYQQGGTDVPDFGVQTDYEQERGGPLVGETMIAGGLPVGEDPRFPMTQEEFSERVWDNLDRSKPEVPLNPAIKRAINKLQGRYRQMFI